MSKGENGGSGGPFHKLHREFLYAAFKGEVAEVDAYLKKGVNVNYKNSHGETALYLVSGMEDGLETLSLLIRRGGDIFTRTNSSQTTLHNAAASGCIGALKMFKELGHGNFNVESWEGSTPLLVATKHLQYASIIYLLDNGANVNNRDFKGSTALFYCARTGWQDGMSLLIERGASLKLMSYSDTEGGEDIVHCSLRYGHKHLVTFLLEKGGKLVSCSTCKRGKNCPRVKPEMAEWFKEQMDISKQQSKGGLKKSSNKIPTVLSAPTIHVENDNGVQSSDDSTNASSTTSPRRGLLGRVKSESRMKENLKAAAKEANNQNTNSTTLNSLTLAKSTPPRNRGFLGLFKKKET